MINRNKILGIMTSWVMLLAMAISSASAMAAKAPEQVVSDTFNVLISNIEANREAYRADPVALYTMVEEVLTPAIHVQSIANKVLGKHVRNASNAQKRDFAEEFKKMLLNSYAVLLLDYSGQELVLKPSEVRGEDRVIVRTELVSGTQEAIPIVFYMSNRGENHWRARNLEGAGVNFVTTYRTTFGQIIAKKGLDGLIAELREKNAGLTQ